MNTVELAIKMTSDGVGPVAADFDAVGAAAKTMGADVDTGTAQADAAASRLSGVADSADNMASSSSQAAGGLGDLGGALSLMPGPLGAVGAGMEAVAPAIMGVTGASDLLNLVTKSNIVMQTRQRAATIASAVASRTVAVATKAWAATQWLLNAALAANPIGLAVIAIAALVAGIVLAYNKSETFRRVVDATMRAARTAIGWVVDKIGDLIGWVRDRAPGAFETMKTLVVGYLEAVTWPIRTMIDLVKDLVGWIGKIDFPDMPDLPDNPFGNPFNRTVTTTTGGTGWDDGSGVPAPAAVFYITIEGALVDPAGTARAIDQLLRDYGFSRGTSSPLAAAA